MHAVLLPLLLAAAPPTSILRLSLADAIQLAQQHSPALAEAAAGVPVAEAGVQAAGALSNPTVGVSYGRDEPRWIESIEQRVPIFGQRSSEVAAAAAEVPIARAELAGKRLDVRIRVRHAYTALVVAQARIIVARQTVELAATIARMARDKYDTGIGTELEAEQAELARRSAQQELMDREGELASAQVGLVEVLGQVTSASVEATDPLWPLPEPPTLDALAARVDHHPDVVRQEAEREAALARVHRERVSLRPLPLVTFELQQEGGAPPTIWLRGGMSMDLPILSQNHGAIAQEQAIAQRAEAGRRAQSWARLSQLRSAYARFQAASRRARFVHEDLVPSSRRVVDLTRLAYELGRTPLLNVLQTQSDLQKAYADGLDAYQGAWDALTDLEEASGGPL